nr:hypothetical protein GCM10020093_004420 [Planobispora longispora]
MFGRSLGGVPAADALRGGGPPRGAAGRPDPAGPRAKLRPLAVTRRELRRLSLPDGLELADPEADMPRPGRGATWVVGDAFSGKVQLAWLTAFPAAL